MTNHLGTQVFGEHDLVFDAQPREMAATFAAVGKPIFATRFIGPYRLADD